MEIFNSPVNGEVVTLEHVNDEMFSKKMLGDGIAVIPHENEIFSPVDGTITMIYETQHAIGIKTDQGAEILIHIGLDTVLLNGKPFQTKTAKGKKVTKGELLTVVDWDMIRNENLDVIVPIVITNKKVEHKKPDGIIKIGDPLLHIL